MFANAVRTIRAQEPPLSSEEPHSEHDQNDRPEAMQAEVEYVVDQEQHAQPDQDGRCRGNLGRIDPLSRAESLRQPEGIWGGLARLNRLGGANRVQNLVHPEKSEKDSDHHVGLPGQVGGQTNDRQNKNTEMGQTLGVLPAVNRAQSKWNSAQDSGNRRIWSRSRAGLNFHAEA